MISFNNLRAINESGLLPSIYRVTGGGTVFTTLGASNSDIFPDTGLVVGDSVYWRITNYINKPRGMRFHVVTAIAAVGLTGAWEYRKADGTWAAFAGLTDNTNSFQTAGTNLDVTWTVPTDWGTNATAINAITGALWWRFRVSALTSYTEGGKIGNTTPSVTQIYDNSVRFDTGSDLDSGTATSGATGSITDTGKAWTVNALMNRIIYIHTGTGAGQVQIIKSNTATVITTLHNWDTTPDNTSQYRICAGFEELYQADVAGGWGVITKQGNNSYRFNCYLEIKAGAFGDINKLVEFSNDYYFFTKEAHTQQYQMHLGWRLPLIYGLNRAIFGNTIISIRTTPLDTRSFGFPTNTEYAFSAKNRYILQHNYPSTGTDSYLRAWFLMAQKTSISDYMEGWRSVTFPKTTTPRTEVRSIDIAFGYSGAEQVNANIYGLLSYFNVGLALYITNAVDYTLPDFELGLCNDVTSRYTSPLAFYAYQGTNTKLIGLKPRLRPMADVYSATSNGIIYPELFFRSLVTDEYKNPIADARILALDKDGNTIFDTQTSNTVFLNAQTVSSGGSYSLGSQPTNASKLRMTIASFTDLSSADRNNARLLIKGTDKDDNAIEEIVFIENWGNGSYFTVNEFKTINASGIVTAGWTGTLTIDNIGLIYPQEVKFEKWQSTDDTTLTLTEYNPITIKISAPSFDPIEITEFLYENQNWRIALKKSILKVCT